AVGRTTRPGPPHRVPAPRPVRAGHARLGHRRRNRVSRPRGARAVREHRRRFSGIARIRGNCYAVVRGKRGEWRRGVRRGKAGAGRGGVKRNRAWQKNRRGPGSGYYSRKKRIKAGWVKVSLGRGAAAELAARLDERERQDRRTERAAFLAAQVRLAAADLAF